MFVLFSNLLGLFPLVHPFTVTSHIIITFALAIFVFLMVIVVGLARHGLHFFSIFAPKVPPVMLLVLIPIEVVSFLSRPISLSVRLFANMLAGHTMLYVFGTFVIGLATAGGVLSLISVMPLLAIIAVAALEFLIAFLQAYVFAILTCIYLNDALNLHGHH
jgi:F-type H+-transporting ATPase subunit a